MFKWIKRNLSQITSTYIHFKIGTQISIPIMLIAIAFSIYVTNPYTAIITLALFVGILVGFEIKQWNLQQGLKKIKFWLNNKFIDSIIDIFVACIIAFIMLIIYLSYI